MISSEGANQVLFVLCH